MTKSKILAILAALSLAAAVLMNRSLPAAPPAVTQATAPAATRVATPMTTLAATATLAPTATLTAPTATLVATATPRPSVSAGDAEQVVRDFFAAVEAKDYARMLDLTSGQARETSEGISFEVQKAEQDNGFTLTPQINNLQVAGTEPRGDGTAVTVDFAIDIKAQAGFLSVPVRSTAGEAVFTVENVDGRDTITNIDGDLN